MRGYASVEINQASVSIIPVTFPGYCSGDILTLGYRYESKLRQLLYWRFDGEGLVDSSRRVNLSVFKYAC